MGKNQNFILGIFLGFLITGLLMADQEAFAQNTLTIKKITEAPAFLGPVDTFPFTVTASGLFPPAISITTVATSLTDGVGLSNTISVPANTDIRITEGIPAGWFLDSVVCISLDNDGENPTSTGTFTAGGNTISGIQVPLNGSVECVFTDKSGSLQIKKITKGGDEKFDYAVTGPISGTVYEQIQFIDTASPLPLGSGEIPKERVEISVRTNLPNSPFAMNEGLPTGWDILSAVCKDLGGNTIASSTGPGENFINNILVKSKDDIVCTFTNEKEETPKDNDTKGAGGHESPTIGKNSAGNYQIVTNGMGIDGQFWTVTQPYHEEMKLIQMLTSPHTISNTIFCNEGVQECNFVGVAFTTKDFDYNNAVMKVEAKKTNGEWIISWYDPQDFIQDPDDAIPGEITFTADIEGDFLLTSFTIVFKNKDTGELIIGIQVRDVELGVRTFWFNEGVEFKDSDAYPSIETEYEKSLEIAPLCLNEDPDYRYSCAFAEKVQLEIERAEKLLAE